jgi:hypothetical protein
MRSAIAQSGQLLQGHTEALLHRRKQQSRQAREPGKGSEFEEAWNSFQCWLCHSMTVTGRGSFGAGTHYRRPVVADSQDELLLRREAQKGKRNRMLLLAGRRTVVVRQRHSQAA